MRKAISLTIKAIIIWLAILCLAVANGALREAVFIPHLGEMAGLTLSGVLLSGLILTVALFTMPWVGARGVLQLIGVGALWLILTLAFEFLFGYLQGKSWSTILDAYAFKEGNIWPVVLLVTVAAPLIGVHLRKWLLPR